MRVAKTKALISFPVNREADLCLCFRIIQIFSCGGSCVVGFHDF